MVSVIIPTYNRAEFLRSAIESALKQTFTDIEIIVSDDRSTDHTRSVARCFNDSRVRYIENTGKKGPSAARNAAIMVSKGKYIAFLDDDDEWLPEKLEWQIEVLEKNRPNVCGIYSNLIAIDKLSGKTFFEDPRTEKLKGNLLYVLGVCNPVKTTTLIVRKSCLDEIGMFDETISYMEDWDLLIRLSEKWDFEYISKPLVKYYYHDQGQLTENIEGQIVGKEALFRRYPHIFKKNKKRWSEYLLGLGLQYCQLKKMKNGRKNILKAIFADPFKTVAYLHFFASLLTPSHYQRLRNFYKSGFN